MRALDDMRLAFQFLTVLPVGRPDPGPLGGTAWCFPLVGLAVGGSVALAFLAAREAGLPSELAGFLAIGVGIAVTGGLHEDGLADTADGLGVRDRRRALEAMRDSRTGAFGVVALALTVPMRALALAAAGPVAALAAHALSRGAMAGAMAWTPPARPDGLAAEAGPTSAVAALLLASGIGIVLGWPAVPAAALAALAAGWWTARRFGGHTGDTLGAVQQATELAVLLALAGHMGAD